MTKAEWVTCTDPALLLEFVRTCPVATSRKSRLVTCALCRAHWDLLYHDASKAFVEVVEKHADGEATAPSRGEAEYAAECPTFGYDFTPSTYRGLTDEAPRGVRRLVEMGVLNESALQLVDCPVDETVRERFLAAANLAWWADRADLGVGPIKESLCVLRSPAQRVLDCVFGPLVFCPVTLDRSWLTTTVISLAQAVYDDRNLPSGLFDNVRLAVLADALEEAGCDNAEVLSHLRSGGEHVRGCWVIDSILGKA